MSKTNKELAVELYSAFLIASGSLLASPNFSGKIQFPTTDQMIETIKELQEKLSTLKDE